MTPFQKKLDTDKFKHQVSTQINDGTYEQLHHLSVKYNKSMPALLREILSAYCQKELGGSVYGVLEGSRQ